MLCYWLTLHLDMIHISEMQRYRYGRYQTDIFSNYAGIINYNFTYK